MFTTNCSDLAEKHDEVFRGMQYAQQHYRMELGPSQRQDNMPQGFLKLHVQQMRTRHQRGGQESRHVKVGDTVCWNYRHSFSDITRLCVSSAFFMNDPADRPPSECIVCDNKANNNDEENEDNDLEDDGDHENEDEVLVEEKDDEKAHNTRRKPKRQVDEDNKTSRWCRKYGCSSAPNSET
ncbi:hypothetical protein ACH5RR_026511 [Cinchona calisaya]|uniref:Uncharacterized protein n=1 Tax=Cinchona calisaya TaxID=153742 RepID=A0ABD2Z2S7_9GENT